MKEFLIKLAKFSFVLIAVATIAQLLLTQRMKGKTTNGRDNFTAIKNQKNDIVFLGNSRCTDHFVPQVFDQILHLKAINLGVSGQGNATMAMLKLDYYLKYNCAPKYVIVNFDPIWSYNSFDINKNNNIILKHYFSRYAFFMEDDNTRIADYYQFNMFERYIPLYAILKYKMLQDCITLKFGKQWLADGYFKGYGVLNEDVANGKTSVNYNDFSAYYDSIKYQLHYLDSTCKMRNIKMICILSPIYVSQYQPEVFSLPGKMCSELSIPFLDYNKPNIVQNRKNFQDLRHLNVTGATLFCRELCNDSTFKSMLTK